MKVYFMDLTCYIPKNKAHEAAQEFARLYSDCLIDEQMLNMDFLKILKVKVEEINKKFTRCENIFFSYQEFHAGTIRVSIEGNFYFSITEVKRFEFAPQHGGKSLQCLQNLKEH